jgi:hypothetical protein
VILAQAIANGTSTDEKVLYAVPDGKKVSVQMISICAQANSTYRLRVTKRGNEAASNKQYVAFDTVIAANTTDYITGISLASGESIYFSGNAATLGFNVFGEEL